MCGIAGYIRLSEETGQYKPDLKSMVGLLRHRGPDDEGFYSDPSSGMGMRRLSIIDLHTGAQPISNEDGSVWVVFNGEIYNYLQLRRTLKDKGHVFKTNSDTEVLVHGYEAWGRDLPKHLRGMFAFAIRDNARHTTMLCRDHFGIKPLYYCEHDGLLMFASEMKSLLHDGHVPRDLDPLSLDRYLSFLYVPEPSTIYKAIKALPAAHTLIIDGKGVFTIDAYWEFKHQGDVFGSEEDAIEAIREVMQDSVQAMMVSDVPLGVFLSSGLDSTCIASIMTRTSRAPVKSFTIGFGSKERHWDELEDTRAIAAKLGTEHTEFKVVPDVVGMLPDVIGYFDQPFANPTSIIFRFLCAETRKHVKVALAGTGGDEMFAGYPRYKGMRVYEKYARVPAFARKAAASMARAFIRDSTVGRPGRQRMRRFLEGGALPFDQCYMHFLTILDNGLKRSLYTDGFLSELEGSEDTYSFIRPYLQAATGLPPLERLMGADLSTYLPYNQLMYPDRMSMAGSLEVRVPFVDQRVSDVAGSIGLAMKLSGGMTKGLFRRAMAPYLPEEILSMPKKGLNLPIALWFRGELKGWIEELLSPGTIRQRGYLRPERVSHIMAEHMRGRRDYSSFLWALAVFELWHRTHIDGHTPASGSGRGEGPSGISTHHMSGGTGKK